MTWDEVLADRQLRDLPFKIELNRWGQVILTAAYNPTGFWQVEIMLRLSKLLPQGRAYGRCLVQTSDGIRVPNVAWIEAARFQQIKEQPIFQLAPGICVEIRSDANTNIEMDDKRRLYFERGAQEVWIVSAARRVFFYSPAGGMERSALCPAFPAELPED